MSAKLSSAVVARLYRKFLTNEKGISFLFRAGDGVGRRWFERVPLEKIDATLVDFSIGPRLKRRRRSRCIIDFIRSFVDAFFVALPGEFS